MDKSYLAGLADDLRRALVHLPPDLTATYMKHLTALEEQYDQRQRTVIKSIQHRFAIDCIVECVVMSAFLRSSRHMRDAIVASCRIVLPAHLADDVVKMVQTKEIRLPSPDKLSRSRVIVDIAFQFFLREKYFASAMLPNLAVSVLIDSSPQFGRDYELALLTSTDLRQCGRLLEIMTRSYDRGLLPPDLRIIDFAAVEQEQIEDMHSMIIVTVLTPTVLGRARCKLSDKLHAFLHAMRLLVPSLQELSVLLCGVVSFCTDLGTEAGIATVPPIPLLRAFPHETQADVSDGNGFRFVPDNAGDSDNMDAGFRFRRDSDIDTDDWLEAAHCASPALCDLSASVEFAGPLHMIHGITNDLGSCMKHFPEQVGKLKNVCKMLTYKAYKRNLLATCYTSATAKYLRKDVVSFKAKVNTQRFGTVADAALEIGKIENGLRYVWQLDLFMSGNQSPRRAPDEDNPHKLHIDDLNDTITSEFFWSYCLMFRCLARSLQHLMRWSESCACHWDLWQLEELPRDVRVGCERCPWRGRRAPELAAGGLTKEVAQVRGCSFKLF